MQQQSQSVVKSTRIRPTRLVRHPHHFATAVWWQDDEEQRIGGYEEQQIGGRPVPSPTAQPEEDIDISLLDTHHFLQLSGMLQAIQVQKQQTGAFPSLNDIDGRGATGRTMPLTPV